jgi:membrane-associated HD superfamily phosphohydrolase
MSVDVIDASKLKSSAVTRKIDRAIENDESIILEFRSGKEVSPDRILRILKASTHRKRVNLVIRDAELKEFVKNGAMGGLIAVAAAIIAVVLKNLRAAKPISLPAVLVVAGISGILGTILAVCLTPVAELKIYRINGVQRIRIEPS